jgi:hypothetical protein
VAIVVCRCGSNDKNKEGRREARLGAGAPRGPDCDRPGLQGVMLSVRSNSSAICHRDVATDESPEGELEPRL